MERIKPLCLESLTIISKTIVHTWKMVTETANNFPGMKLFDIQNSIVSVSINYKRCQMKILVSYQENKEGHIKSSLTHVTFLKMLF